jgi:peptidoglycan/LPS O-acetylase OafA/YrhL
VDKSEDIKGESFSLYLPAVDGLRFFAFLLVFLHHLIGAPGWLAWVSARGWIGVELFFCISSFLFFRLFQLEQESVGQINITRFYGRRLLRLYPLMVAFPTLMLLWSVGDTYTLFGRLAGIWFFSDNFLAWLNGFNPIFASSHLWTLSFEFQVYAVIPIAFLIYRSAPERFGAFLLAIWVVALGARLAFLLVGAHHPIIWMTPFLHPETILGGMALGAGLFDKFSPRLVGGLGIAAIFIFAALPNILPVSMWTMLLYPSAAISCLAVLWFACNADTVGAFLSRPWIVFLGKVSFGLYVFHLLGLWLADQVVTQYFLRGVLAFALTVGMATASYFLFERWFLLLKDRISIVRSRLV